ncbi:MAG: hypothetical protein PHY48_08515 [Candidatus Cloacimonetes bacterium]|nr:hypothetical protein [Candidatus Cloacimonadota bacterium]
MSSKVVSSKVVSSKVVSGKVVSGKWGLVAYLEEMSFGVALDLLFWLVQMLDYSMLKNNEIMSLSKVRI